MKANWIKNGKIYLRTFATLRFRLASGAISVAQQRCRDQLVDCFAIGRRSVHSLRTYGFTGKRYLEKLDTVFNYGIFDFSKPNFIYRFAKEKPITDSQRNIHATSWSNMRCGGAKSPNKSWISIPQEKHGYGKPWWLITGRKTACIAIISFSTIVRQDPPPLSKIRQMEK